MLDETRKILSPSSNEQTYKFIQILRNLGTIS